MCLCSGMAILNGAGKVGTETGMRSVVDGIPGIKRTCVLWLNLCLMQCLDFINLIFDVDPVLWILIRTPNHIRPFQIKVVPKSGQLRPEQHLHLHVDGVDHP